MNRHFSWSVYIFLSITIIISGNAASQELTKYNQNISTLNNNTAHPKSKAEIKYIVDHMNSGDLMRSDTGIRFLQNLLNESEAAGSLDGISGAVCTITVIYGAKGRYEDALNILNEALFVCSQSAKNREALFIICNCIGTLYQNQGNYDKAAYYYYKGIALCEHFSFATAGGIYTNVGEMLLQLKQYKRALYYLDKAEKIAFEKMTARSIDSASGYEVIGYVLANKSILYANQKEWDKSISCLLSSLSISRRYGQPQLKLIALTNLGNVYILKKMPKEALPYILEAEAMPKEGVDLYYQNGTTKMLSEIYFQLHDYDKAEYYLLKNLNSPEIPYAGNALIDIYSLLSKIYIAKKDYKRALGQFQIYVQLKDSLNNIAATKNLDQLEVKYRTFEKDKILTKNKLLIIQQQKKITGITLSALVLIILFVIIYIIYRNKQNIQTKHIQILQQEQEIKQLKAMMDGEEKERGRIAHELHDGVGSMLASIKLNLGTIKETYTEEKSEKIADIMYMLEDTSLEIRRMAHNLMPDVLIKHTLVEALVLYCENINTSNKLEIDLQFHGDIITLNKSVELILYRITQELIQNIIKHSKANYAVIQISKHDNSLCITVEDNGVGFNIDQKSGGYGLQNLQFRVKGLQGNISIMSTVGTGTTIFIEFDYKKLTAIKNYEN